MDQRCGLKSLARRLALHFGSSQAAEFLINEREKFLRGFGITVPYTVEHLCEIAHSLEFSSA